MVFETFSAAMKAWKGAQISQTPRGCEMLHFLLSTAVLRPPRAPPRAAVRLSAEPITTATPTPRAEGSVAADPMITANTTTSTAARGVLAGLGLLGVAEGQLPLPPGARRPPPQSSVVPKQPHTQVRAECTLGGVNVGQLRKTP